MVAKISDEKMKILVTGGAGFIGSHLVNKLIEKGHDVTIMDNLTPQVHPRSQIPDYVPIKLFKSRDVRGKKFYNEVSDYEIIFHLAAAVGIGQSQYMPKDYYDNNVLGTANLWQALIDKPENVKKVIVASSMSIYGEGRYLCKKDSWVYPEIRSDKQLAKHDFGMRCPNCDSLIEHRTTPEYKPLSPTSIYALTKMEQEKMSLLLGKEYHIPTIALRLFNTYGPRQSLNNPYTGVAAIFSSMIKAGNPPLIFEDGNQLRDFIYVDDVVEAFIHAMNTDKIDYTACNVGTEEPHSIYEIASMLIDEYGVKMEPNFTDKYRSGDIRTCYADISQIRASGWTPKVSLRDGIHRLVEWSRSIKSEDKSEIAKYKLEEFKLLR
jgi:dTDP-L-rhamnose 4-epimerase